MPLTFQGWKLSWGGLSDCELGFCLVQAGQKPGPQAGKPDPTARRYTLRQVQKGKVSGIVLQLANGLFRGLVGRPVAATRSRGA
jgi:hypothetical protein